ncbi:hypothetical protein [Limnohabitans sp.]|uniref:hypothetical protein n=1 Tax=Limnohabitans sp. TaxID=1907725 RepID=UPI0025C0818F|nr:hypothetical protein [Limnohabitans sp.]
MNYLALGTARTLFMCAAFSLAGCVSTDGVSFPVSFPAASQYKLKSAAHWQLIAEDVAGQMKQSLMAQNHLQAAIYLEEPAQPTAFERSLLPMLRAGLLSQGLKVSVRSQDAAVLKVQVSKVSHVASYRPGTLTLLGGGLLVLREIVRHHSPVLINAGGALAAITADVAMTRNNTPPDLELILSVSVQKEGQYLATSNQVYYLSSQDLDMYQNLPLTGRIFPVNGPGESK